MCKNLIMAASIASAELARLVDIVRHANPFLNHIMLNKQTQEQGGMHKETMAKVGCTNTLVNKNGNGPESYGKDAMFKQAGQ